jgi:hypothetical protein
LALAVLAPFAFAAVKPKIERVFPSGIPPWWLYTGLSPAVPENRGISSPATPLVFTNKASKGASRFNEPGCEAKVEPKELEV